MAVPAPTEDQARIALRSVEVDEAGSMPPAVPR
ncbi:hypothetical protein EQZ23_19425 [Sphingomonas sp. UV9]|nr:hypothetical protein EQZ23_19425 [Sphingomonas sp. UV9]